MKKKDRSQMLARKQLLEDINSAKNALDSAYSNFQNAVDPNLIDCYIYEVNSVQKRYQFLLEQARMMNGNDIS